MHNTCRPWCEDHIDRFLSGSGALPADNGIDLDVEGIVDRINGISRRIKRGMEATLAELDLTLADWQMLCALAAPRRDTGARRARSRPTSSSRAAR